MGKIEKKLETNGSNSSHQRLSVLIIQWRAIFIRLPAIFRSLWCCCDCSLLSVSRWVRHHDSSLPPAEEDGLFPHPDLHSLHHDGHPGSGLLLDQQGVCAGPHRLWWVHKSKCIFLTIHQSEQLSVYHQFIHSSIINPSVQSSVCPLSNVSICTSIHSPIYHPKNSVLPSICASIHSVIHPSSVHSSYQLLFASPVWV